MLRQTQHEQKRPNGFTTRPVHPEIVEGRTRSISERNTIDRIFTERFGALDERLSKTDLFDFLRAYAVFGDMRNPVFWPHHGYHDNENV